MSAFNDIKQMVPPSLRKRLDWTGGYVAEFVSTTEADTKDQFKLSRVKLQQLQVVFFAWALDRFLNEGTNAAIGAVDELEKLKVVSFRVGSSTFSGRNENVMLGHNLSLALRNVIPMKATLERMDKSKSFEGALKIAYQEVKRA